MRSSDSGVRIGIFFRALLDEEITHRWIILPDFKEAFFDSF
jgi:hypothetical protein